MRSAFEAIRHGRGQAEAEEILFAVRYAMRVRGSRAWCVSSARASTGDGVGVTWW